MDAIKSRGRAFNNIVRIQTKINDHDNNPISEEELRVLNNELDTNWNKLEAAHDEAMNDAVDDQASAVQEIAYSPMWKTYIKVKSDIEQIRSSFISAAVKADPTTVVKQDLRLPVSRLPPFSGGFAEWQSFHDLFCSLIHNRTDITSSQKLQFLKSAVEGDAAKLIASLSITEDNYSEALSILQERYDNKREIVRQLIEKIFRQKVIKVESAVDLQSLLDNVTQCIRSLNVLGRPTEHWDDLLVYLMETKFPADAARQWAIKQTGTDPPTMDDLKSFLQEHIRGLARVSTSSIFSGRKERGNDNMRTYHVSTGNSCPVCKGSHQIFHCEKFINKSAKEKQDLVKQLNLCCNCLRPGHSVNGCWSKHTCKTCSKRHNTLLHVEEQPPPKPQPAAGSKGERGTSSNHVSIQYKTEAQLMTALVTIPDVFGKMQLVRAFIDNGSQPELMSEECAKRLGLKRSASSLKITGVGGVYVGKTRGMINASIHSRYSDQSVNVSFNVIPMLTHLLPNVQVKSDWAHFRGLELADPNWYMPAGVDIIIGVKHYDDIMQPGIRRAGGNKAAPVARNSIFGWIVRGVCPTKNSSNNACYAVQEDINEVDILRRFWEVEEPPTELHLTKEQLKCEEHFVSTTKRDNDGRFIVSIPFNEKQTQLGMSRMNAVKRLLSVEKRIARQPHLREQYVNFMREYAELGHMEKIDVTTSPEVRGSTYYLPHHFVTNECSSTTKLRVVFDGSCQTSSGISLNDTMLIGAIPQDDLFDIILRYRMHPFVLKADVTKMFRQFKLVPEHCDYHRIVWRESPDMQIEDYRLCTVTYGTASATSLSTRCLKQLSTDIMEIYPKAASIINTGFFIDDLMTGTPTEEEAVKLFEELKTAFNSAGMELRKWCSNSKLLLQHIPQELHDTAAQSFDANQTIKALGVQWQPIADSFTFSSLDFTQGKGITMRKVLADLARVFDPIGFVSCVTIRAKLIFQELWKLNLNWDDKVPDHIQQIWNEYLLDIQDITRVKILRHIPYKTAIQHELHGFSDASEKAYGAIIYIRILSADGVETSFVTSKCKVAPIKQHSLPRLELCAAVLLSDLAARVIKTMELTCKVFLWTDSSIALHWINESPHRWQTYVGNRVAAIQRAVPAAKWQHVPGTSNPADLVSRGIKASEIINNKFWWSGPDFLKQWQLPESSLPLPVIPDSVNLEQRRPKVLAAVASQADLSLVEKYSTLTRLQRVTSWCQRFIRNCRSKPNAHTSNQSPAQRSPSAAPLTPVELQRALITWIRVIQRQYYSKEIDKLQGKHEINHSSKLKSLHPFLDTDGVLRVSGRLERANIPEASKHQIILPGESTLTKLIIAHQHEKLFHAAFQHLWATLQRTFWIIKGRDRVRHFVRSCVRCRRHRASTAEQLMGALPLCRISQSRPFQHTGVDYAGPFTLKDNVGRVPKTFKGYLCLFVCMATKAIRLEGVISLSTESFLSALQRFVSRSGVIPHMYSDCGTNFIGAENELKRLVRSRKANDEISNKLSKDGVTWSFNPPASPHHGGLWEAGVKSAKFHLRRVLGNSVLTFEQFQTILCQVEAVLNSRPLYAMSPDPADFAALTPSHFLTGGTSETLPSEDLEGVPRNRLSIYQYQQQRVQHFWRRWSSEYLNTLQQRTKWMWESKNVNVGDLVLLKEETAPATWKMGRVLEVKYGSDGLVRVVSIKTESTILERPIVKLVPLVNNDDK